MGRFPGRASPDDAVRPGDCGRLYQRGDRFRSHRHGRGGKRRPREFPPDGKGPGTVPRSGGTCAGDPVEVALDSGEKRE